MKKLNSNFIKITQVSILVFGIFVLSGCSSDINPVVKKSNTGICHEKESNYYDKTKNFNSYNSLSDCLDSGGRKPKK